MGLFGRKKAEVKMPDVMTLDDFNKIPDDNKIKEVFISEDKPEETQSASEHYKSTSLPELPEEDKEVIKVNYKTFDEVPEVPKEMSSKSEGYQYLGTPRFNLGLILIKKYLDDKLVYIGAEEEFNIGNTLAGIKFVDNKLYELLGERMEESEKQVLLSKATSYINQYNVVLVGRNIQTKGKLVSTKDYLRRLRKLSQSELRELLQMEG